MTEDKKKKKKERIDKELTFIRCPRHGESYPKGSSCPKCEAEKRK